MDVPCRSWLDEWPAPSPVTLFTLFIGLGLESASLVREDLLVSYAKY
jgi:hypothetical protein